jgi:hypothetical protein
MSATGLGRAKTRFYTTWVIRVDLPRRAHLRFEGYPEVLRYFINKPARRARRDDDAAGV